MPDVLKISEEIVFDRVADKAIHDILNPWDSKPALGHFAEKALRKAHGFETVLDIQEELKDPQSVRMRKLVNELAEISHHLFKEDFIKKLIRRWHRIKALLAALRGRRGAVDDTDDLEEEELRMQEQREELARLEHRLDLSPIKFLDVLLKEREDIISNIVKEWRDQQIKQVNRMASVIKDIIPLSQADIDYINQTPKAAEILHYYPELIPAGVKPGDAFERMIQIENTAKLVRTMACNEANNYSGEYTLYSGTPPDPNDPRQPFPDKAVYIHLINDVLHYSAKDSMGNVFTKEIKTHEMHEVHFKNIKHALDKHEVIGDESKNAIFDVISKDGYTQKFERHEIRSLHESSKKNGSVASFALVPEFKKNRDEDIQLMEKQLNDDFEKLKKKTEEIRALNAEESVKKLDQDVKRSFGKYEPQKDMKEVVNKYNSPTPFSTKLKPPWIRTSQ